RWTWTGGWGLAAALALQTSLGAVGSWVVGGALLLVSVLAATELGFHWIAALAHGAVLRPALSAAAAYGSWQGSRADSRREPKKPRESKKKARPVAAVVEPDGDADDEPPPRISGPNGGGAKANGNGSAIAVPVIKAPAKPKLR